MAIVFLLGFGEAHGLGDFQRKATNAPGVALGCGVTKIHQR